MGNNGSAPDLSSRLLRLVIVGHVDHGKSTLVGRLLSDTGSLPEKRALADIGYNVYVDPVGKGYPKASSSAKL